MVDVIIITSVRLPTSFSSSCLLQKGFTPLHEAARHGHIRIIEILLKYYDNPDPEGKVGDCNKFTS